MGNGPYKDYHLFKVETLLWAKDTVYVCMKVNVYLCFFRMFFQAFYALNGGNPYATGTLQCVLAFGKLMTVCEEQCKG